MTTVEKVVAVVDVSRYNDICQELELILGLEAVATLNGQIQAMIQSALVSLGIPTHQLPFKSTGDGAILVLNTADQGHLFAEAVHREAQNFNQKKDRPLAQRHFRLGLCRGRIALQTQARADGTTLDFEFAGATIASAVRLEGACRTGEVLISSETWANLPPNLRTHYGDEETITGKRGEHFLAHRRRVVDPAPWDASPGAVIQKPSANDTDAAKRPGRSNDGEVGFSMKF